MKTFFRPSGVWTVVLFCFYFHAGPLYSADWNQWRGANRDGVDHNSPKLIEQIPATGIVPVWMTDKKVPGGGSGFSCPIVVDGKVFVASHLRSSRPNVELGPEKYPNLTPEQREKLSPEQATEYQLNRQKESQERNLKKNRYSDMVYCLSAATGKVLWTNDYESAPTRWRQSSTPAVVGSRLFVLSADRKLRCINAVDGKDIWATPLPGDARDKTSPLTSSVAVTDGVALALGGVLLGVDASSGEILWKGDPKETSGFYSSPVLWKIAGRELVVANVGGSSTVCVDPRSGKEIWRVQSYASRSTPLIVGNKLITYSSSRKGGLACFNISLEKAEKAWIYRGISDPGSSPVAVNGLVFAQGDRKLVCVDLETGKLKWRETLNVTNPRYTSLIAADGKVIFAVDGLLCFAADSQGYRELIDARIDNEGLLHTTAYFRKQLDMDKLESTSEGQAKAQSIWRRALGQNSPMSCVTPAVADGKLYMRLKSRIACFDLSAKK